MSKREEEPRGAGAGALALHPTTLRGLGVRDAQEAIATLVALKSALPACGDPLVLEALAQALPDRVADLVPEVCLAVQEIALALAAHRPRIPADVLTLEPRLRTLWLRVALSTDDGVAVIGAIDESLLLHVVTGWSLDALPSPLPLLTRLSRARDGRLRMVVLRSLEPLVQSLALTGQQAFDCLEPLASDPELTIRADAIRALSRSWLVGLTPAAARRRERLIEGALHHAHPLVVRAAVEATNERGVRRWLVEILDDASPAVRAEVIPVLGRLAEADDLDRVLTLATDDPLRFGQPARAFLLEAHRHGVFVREQHLEAVLALFDGHLGWTAEELIRVTHIARVALVKLLAELPADDPRWLRRAAVLATSIGTGAHLVLAKLLETTTDARSAVALLEAAGRSPEFSGEERLLRWLVAAPEAVIPVLRVKGGALAATRLRALVEDPFSTRALRSLAMDALWALTEDRPALLRELSAKLGPHESGLLDSKHLSPHDSTAAQLLSESAWAPAPHHAIEPNAQLKIYCESGDARFLPDVTRLFREVFRSYVRRALAGDFSIKRLLLPELEQTVFRYGRHLVKDGRSVRRWIDDGPETGRDLVLLLVCDWLAESPSEAVCVALLETAARHSPSGATLRFIEPFWRRGDANVKRAAIEALLAAGDGARGLELSLGRLAADAGDPRILCQALAAVRTLRAAWAEPIVRAALSRPEMGVKKEAADALAEIGSAASVPELVKWLARHDNDSFRASLRRALERAAGASLTLVLVHALEHETEARSKELLHHALSGHLTLAAVLRLARSKLPVHRELVDACLEGEVALADAKSDVLAARLHRAKLRVIEPKVDPTRRLRLEGFSAEAAEELVALRTPKLDAVILPVVRLGLAEWLTWLGASFEPSVEAVTLVLDAAAAGSGGLGEHLDGLMDVIDRTVPMGAPVSMAAPPPNPHERTAAAPRSEAASVDPERVAAFIERAIAPASVDATHKQRAIGLLRALPPSAELGGHRRYRLLGRLGAVRTLADLASCLDECRVRPDSPGETTALLFEALAIPAPRDDDAAPLLKLRAEAKEWHRAEPAPRQKWLAEMVEARPLDLPLVGPPIAPPAKPPFTPSSQADLDALIVTLENDGDVQERQRAAERILGWADARVAWDQVLAAYLAGRVEFSGEPLGRLARSMRSWPEAGQASGSTSLARRVALVPLFDAQQLRVFVPRWLERWDGGDPHVEELLRALGQERLIPYVAARAALGNYSLARLLRPGSTLALRSLIERIGRDAPSEIEHLLKEPEAPDAHDAGDPIDPIAGKTLEDLVRLIAQRGVDKGLAVRAVHALTQHKERAVDPLEKLTTDRRPQVRSAALRALRVVAPRERTLEATSNVLKMETRRDVVLHLMASLGHGRHEPALPGLLERLTDRDYRIRQGAHAALRAWGRDAIPALRHAARRARPDRRPLYEALIADLK